MSRNNSNFCLMIYISFFSGIEISFTEIKRYLSIKYRISSCKNLKSFECVIMLVWRGWVNISLICELMLNEFKLGRHTAKITKNTCYAKGEGTVDQSTATRWL